MDSPISIKALLADYDPVTARDDFGHPVALAHLDTDQSRRLEGEQPRGAAAARRDAEGIDARPPARCDYKAGDRVRVIENASGGCNPDDITEYLQPGDVILVDGLVHWGEPSPFGSSVKYVIGFDWQTGVNTIRCAFVEPAADAPLTYEVHRRLAAQMEGGETASCDPLGTPKNLISLAFDPPPATCHALPRHASAPSLDRALAADAEATDASARTADAACMGSNPRRVLMTAAFIRRLRQYVAAHDDRGCSLADLADEGEGMPAEQTAGKAVEVFGLLEAIRDEATEILKSLRICGCSSRRL